MNAFKEVALGIALVCIIAVFFQNCTKIKVPVKRSSIRSTAFNTASR
jgi:hypothetical protein